METTTAVRRCKWCGRFLARDTVPTVRSLRIISTDRWRTVQQMLCPQHAAEWSVDHEWNKEPDWSLPVEVL
jgi:hypothetical protein